jgi:glycosyltransferase involved in cell wall biosynthesis
MTSNYEDYYVIVPVYNEQRHIQLFLKKLKKYTKNIIVVNDGSIDKTAEILKKIKNINTVNLNKNKGKGAAMREGANLAWNLGAKGIVFMDGDNQHNPQYLPIFFESLKRGEDIILGVRVLKAHVPIYRMLGNKIAELLIIILFGVHISDILCGYRAFSKRIYKKIVWQSNDYGVETEVITLIGRKKIPYNIIVVDTIYIDKFKGFSIKDGIKIMLKLPFWKIRKI